MADVQERASRVQRLVKEGQSIRNALSVAAVELSTPGTASSPALGITIAAINAVARHGHVRRALRASTLLARMFVGSRRK